ncbi:hypothetical protein Tco_1288999, partial [Tanacetum coccineum]
MLPQDSDSDIEEDKMSRHEYISDIIVEFKDKALLINQRRFYERSGRVGTTKAKEDSFHWDFTLMKSGHKTLNTARQNSSKAAVSVNTARPINTVYPKPTVNCARPESNVFNRVHSHVKSPFNMFTSNKNNNINEKINTVKGNVTIVGPKAV